jgi:hypothetical protein
MYLIWENDLPKTHINVTWGLRNDLPSGRLDVVFLAHDLNSGLGRSSSFFRENSAMIFSRTSRDRAIEVFCTVKEPQRIDSVNPPINRDTRGGVDSIPLLLATSRSLPLPSLSHSFSRCSNLVPAVPLRPLVQLPTPARPEPAPPLRATLLQCMRIKTLCQFKSKPKPSSEMAAEAACIPDPRTAWVRSRR